MKVTVLYGGPSAEREVSLVSGKAVIDGLRSMGHEVFPSDISPTDLSGLDSGHTSGTAGSSGSSESEYEYEYEEEPEAEEKVEEENKDQDKSA